MVQFTNSTYSGADITIGQYNSNSDEYHSDSAGTTNVSYTLNGTVTAVGSTVSVVVTTNGTPASAVTYTYEGYYDQNGVAIYVFSDGTSSSQSFAISSQSGAVATVDATNPVKLIQTGTVPVCFLRGTRIATPDGEVAVESLKVGDLVAVREGADIVYRPASWIGHRKAHVLSGTAAIEEFPVRVRADAVRDGVPSRDLLVTSEHCLFIDGKLIPARMLVNGTSIVFDTTMNDFEFFHVELEQHAVLIADGMEAESYLDTGNRGNFANSDVASLVPILSLNAGHRSWATHAVAPLATDRATVEPIWAALLARAATLGFQAAAPAMIDHEPELRLLTADGTEIRPSSVEGNTYGFIVPANAHVGVGQLRLLSRTFRPSDAIGSFVDDRRTLGVFVGKIGVSVNGQKKDVSAHLVDADLAGWHPVEGEARWTTGDALIPVNQTHAQSPVAVEIEIITLGLYRVEATDIAA